MTENAGFLPSRIVSGETIWIAAANSAQDAQDITFDDYSPADGHTLKYQFAASTAIEVTAVANDANDGWTLTVTAAQTLTFQAGNVNFVALVTTTDGTFAVDQGTIYVSANPTQTSDYAAALTAVDAAIADYGSNPHSSFMLDGMQVTYRSLKDLLNLRSHYKSLIAEETGKRQKRIIRTRFT